MLLTLREMSLFAEGAAKRAREDYRQQIAVAHLSAALSRVPRNKRLPRLSSLLPREERVLTPKERRVQTLAIMDAFVKSSEKKRK